MRRRTRNDPVDTLIERLYYTHAQGRQISILKIGDLFRDARTAIVNGSDPTVAVQTAIAKYTEAV